MRRTRLQGAAAIATAFATLATIAHADGLRGLPADAPPAYVRECGDCHVAYPPGLLPATSWRRLMAGLDRHYGSDASLEPQLAQEIARWLQSHAGTYKRVREAPPEDRITRSAWFERKHREIDPSIWTLPSVVGPSNCVACHAGAAQGAYDDDDLRVPEGVTPRQRRAWAD